MNCKLEKFWNSAETSSAKGNITMNCKLEKFWNSLVISLASSSKLDEL